MGLKINRAVCLKSGCRRFTYPEASAAALSKIPNLCASVKWNTEPLHDRSKWTDTDIVPDDCLFKTEQAVSQC